MHPIASHAPKRSRCNKHKIGANSPLPASKPHARTAAFSQTTILLCSAGADMGSTRRAEDCTISCTLPANTTLPASDVGLQLALYIYSILYLQMCNLQICTCKHLLASAAAFKVICRLAIDLACIRQIQIGVGEMQQFGLRTNKGDIKEIQLCRVHRSAAWWQEMRLWMGLQWRSEDRSEAASM